MSPVLVTGCEGQGDFSGLVIGNFCRHWHTMFYMVDTRERLVGDSYIAIANVMKQKAILVME